MDASEYKPLEGLHELVSKTITYNTTVLGRGSYAAVYKAKCGELPCAVKILHSIFQEDPDVGILAESFNRECEYLKNIRHPNIVQYLGLCRDPQTHHPALLMELMDQSLTRFLESSSDRLAPRIEVSICHDTALALAHLHSIGIVHRDLSSNNVLLIGAGSRAKVCDFGMSKVIDARYSRYSSTPQLHSKCPGTVAYMPPEALVEVPGYTKKLDCFSFGVLSIQIMTRLFPNPTARTKMIESPLSLTGMVIVPVLETECRKDHIDMIDQLNPLLPVAIRCLALKKEERPSACELCELMEEVRRNITDHEVETPETSMPIQRVHTMMTNEQQQYDGRDLETIIRHKDDEIINLHQQLEDKQAQSDSLSERIVEAVAMRQNVEGELRQLRRDLEENISLGSVHARRCDEFERIKRNQEEAISSLHQELDKMFVIDITQSERCRELEGMYRKKEEKMTSLQKELEERLSVNYIQSEKCAELEKVNQKQKQEIANLLQQLGEKLCTVNKPDGVVPKPLNDGVIQSQSQLPPVAAPHPPSRHPPSVGAHHPPPVEAHHPPPVGARHPPPVEAHHPPPVEAHHPPPVGARHPPPVEAHHPPPVEARHPPPVEGRHPPPVEAHHPPPVEARHPPPVEGRHPPPVEGRHPPPVEGCHPPPVGEDYQISNYLPINDWKVGTPAPSGIAQSSSVVHGHHIFCSKIHLVYFFDVKYNNWTQLPQFRYNNFFDLFLFIENGSGMLYALKDNEMCHYQDERWIKDGYLGNQIDSPATSIYYNGHIIKIIKTGILHVFHLSGVMLSSHHISPAINYASANIIHESLYLVGVQMHNEWTSRIFRAKLVDIFNVPKKSWFKKEDDLIQWQEVAPLPVSRSTSISFKEHLIAVGGYNSTTGEASNQIFVYSEPQNKWDVIGFIPTARYGCVVEVVGNKLVVIGGWLNQFTKCDIVEVGTINIV